MKDRNHPLLTALRSGTAAAHRQLEEVSGGDRIMNGTLTLPEYDRLLRWQSDAHARLEPAAAFALRNYHYRSRRPLLPQSSLAPLSAPADLSELVGRLYVLEGASLGGSLIHRKLLDNTSLTPRRPFPFYAWQAEHGIAQWRAFLGAVTQGKGINEDRAVLAAQTAFQTFADLY